MERGIFIKRKSLFSIILFCSCIFISTTKAEKMSLDISDDKVSQYVEPSIGSQKAGHVFIGPSCPFGMVKPSPDCGKNFNSGYAPIPSKVEGFSQIHVNGTGGGPKYGNILLFPFSKESMDSTKFKEFREYETMKLGYYDTKFKGSGIRTEITTADRASFYRFTYPQASQKCLSVDAGYFLGEYSRFDDAENQEIVGSEIQIISNNALCGYSRVRGGWGHGRAYTVYFYAEANQPFSEVLTWKDGKISKQKSQSDTGKKTGALLRFNNKENSSVLFKVGISFVGCVKAKSNLYQDIPHWSFEEVYQNLVSRWEKILGRIKVSSSTPKEEKQMFYTGLYHTMLMPVDRHHENPSWVSTEPYYDDFYAIWDTYRTSLPLINLITPERGSEIVRSLIDTYKNDNYMPDARSGNSNGRTQGGSNADIVLADAYVKGIKGIDYELALKGMLKNGEIDPGAYHEQEGRGGLNEYKKLGFVPWGISRAGTRTVEYSMCDYAIATLAKGLGKNDIYKEYIKRSSSWKNIWRSDYEYNGVKGFIMPRASDGKWLDQVDSLKMYKNTYSPDRVEGGFTSTLKHWQKYFYEGTSWIYSLSIPHDVPGLIEMCGGKDVFEQRLDNFFDKKHYNIGNEPSFLTPCLYHWIGKPYRSAERIHETIKNKFTTKPDGLPGNDDSGAMSAWLVFHMMGLYPNAGHDYYLINPPIFKDITIFAKNQNNPFRIVTKNFSSKNCYIKSIKLNGKEYPYSTIKHHDIINGGTMIIELDNKPSDWGRILHIE